MTPFRQADDAHMKASLATLFVVLGCFASIATALADDGTAHNGPHNVPGVIRAVDFNDGGSLVAYYAATPGNRRLQQLPRRNGRRHRQRSRRALRDRSRTDQLITDWLKYTIDVSQAGWYGIHYFARTILPGSGVNLLTLIDDRPLGITYQSAPIQDDFAEVWPQGIHLAAGRHVLGLLVGGQLVAIDRIEITRVSSPPALTPRIVRSWRQATRSWSPMLS